MALVFTSIIADTLSQDLEPWMTNHTNLDSKEVGHCMLTDIKYQTLELVKLCLLIVLSCSCLIAELLFTRQLV